MRRLRPAKVSLVAMHPFFADLINYDERSLSAYLTLLAQGPIRVRTIPMLSSAKRQRRPGHDKSLGRERRAT